MNQKTIPQRLMALLLSKPFVSGYGITGAAWMYVLLMGVLALSLFAAMELRLKKEKKELERKPC